MNADQNATIARLLGWVHEYPNPVVQSCTFDCDHWRNPKGKGRVHRPDWTSPEGCFGLGGPVEWIEQQGWEMQLRNNRGGAWTAYIWRAFHQPLQNPHGDGEGDTPTEALLLALLAAVEREGVTT